jgi:hypothetical protein
MAQPTFSRRSRLTRRGRLVRSILIGFGIVIVIALIVGNLGGGKQTPEPPTAQVSFDTSVQTQHEGKNVAPGAADAERSAITTVLNDWFQTAFVDTKKFGDANFPSVQAHFAKEARASFTKDLATLTIGDARDEVKRVAPDVARARIALYFANQTPTFALVRVTFSATATMKDKTAPPLRIVFTGDLTLEKQNGTWVVTYYKANQTQNSVQPSPSGSTSP